MDFFLCILPGSPHQRAFLTSNFHHLIFSSSVSNETFFSFSGRTMRAVWKVFNHVSWKIEALRAEFFLENTCMLKYLSIQFLFSQNPSLYDQISFSNLRSIQHPFLAVLTPPAQVLHVSFTKCKGQIHSNRKLSTKNCKSTLKSFEMEFLL